MEFNQSNMVIPRKCVLPSTLRYCEKHSVKVGQCYVWEVKEKVAQTIIEYNTEKNFDEKTENSVHFIESVFKQLGSKLEGMEPNTVLGKYLEVIKENGYNSREIFVRKNKLFEVYSLSEVSEGQAIDPADAKSLSPGTKSNPAGNTASGPGGDVSINWGTFEDEQMKKAAANGNALITSSITQENPSPYVHVPKKPTSSIADIGFVEFLNPRFRQSMEDGHCMADGFQGVPSTGYFASKIAIFEPPKQIKSNNKIK